MCACLSVFGCEPRLGIVGVRWRCVHIPMCLSNAYGVSRERLQKKTIPASPSLDHVCVCVGGSSLVSSSSTSCSSESSKLASPTASPRTEYNLQRRQGKTRQKDRINTIIRDGSLDYPPFPKLNIKICLQNRNLRIILHDSTSTTSRLVPQLVITTTASDHRLRIHRTKEPSQTPSFLNPPTPRVLHVRQVHMTG